MRSKLESENTSKMTYMERISRITSKAQESSVLSLAKSAALDYSNTRFHNVLVVKHDQDQFVAAEIQKGAFDLAREEATKRSIQKAQKENVCRTNEQRAKQRG